jgi:hypothetical protein
MKQLQGLDASFVALEQPNAPMHIGSILIYDPASAPGGFVRFKGHCHINLVKAQDWQRVDDQAFRAAAFQPLNAPARNLLNKGRLIRWR